MITAEVFIINKKEKNNLPPTPDQVEEWLIEFARMHVQQALINASEEGKIIIDGFRVKLDKESVLNAYSIENIK